MGERSIVILIHNKILKYVEPLVLVVGSRLVDFLHMSC